MSRSTGASLRPPEPRGSSAQGPRHLWHSVAIDEVAHRLGTDRSGGLPSAEAARRLASYGPNSIESTDRVGRLTVLVRQFRNPMVAVLVAAAALSVALGERVDAVTILAIVALNALLGFVQEWRAERAVTALRVLLSPGARVVRSGRPARVEARTLVPGDVVLIEVGDRVPADLRLVEAVNLRADESILTGEAVAVRKDVGPVPAGAPLVSRSSMAWSATTVAHGRGTGIVVATGMDTELGRIARMTVEVVDEPTPLQRQLGRLGRMLGSLALAAALVVVGASLLVGRALPEALLTGVSLAVAAIPEGLPAVMTITFALGTHVMARRRALVRKLAAAETLGAATVICTDKTGTLTRNEMTLTHLWLPGGSVDVTGVGYDAVGEIRSGGRTLDPGERSDVAAALEVGLHCSHARLFRGPDGAWGALGQPTEAALLVAARKAGLDPDSPLPHLQELSFTSERKRMTVVVDREGDATAFTKGAPEVIVARSSRILDGADERGLTAADREGIVRAYEAMADDGLRVLALARRRLPESPPRDQDSLERELTFLGLAGILDPPRPEVPAAIELATTAGVRVVMITGDAAATAAAVARRVGLPATVVVTGAELDAMDDAGIREALGRQAIFARTDPEQKLRLVTVLQEQGHVVAMTGDGVNDAPALKRADVGVAMGIQGTDVARGAAEVVLSDDNFATIVGAVEEGRRQNDNLRKFVRYLLSSNLGEVVAIVVNILTRGPLILLPVQILWINLVTDGVTAVSLGVEPAEPGVMRRPPRPPSSPILDRKGLLVVSAIGLYIGAATVWVFDRTLVSAGPEGLVRAQTMAFTTIVLLEKMNVFNFRSLSTPLSSLGLLSNRWVLVAWTGNLALHLAVVYAPFFQDTLGTAALGLGDWAVVAALSLPVFLVVESVKWTITRSREGPGGRT